MEDDHRSRRLSTSKTEENVEQVWQVCSDCHLTVTKITNELSMNSVRVWMIIME